MSPKLAQQKIVTVSASVFLWHRNATRPPFTVYQIHHHLNVPREQGAQLALLDYRLRFAAQGGCDIAMIVTQPGSASQRNAERQGFHVAYTRTKWQLGTKD